VKILVTGGAGFIGSNLVDRMIKDGHYVYVVDNLSTGSLRNLSIEANFIEGSISNYQLLKYIFESFTPEVVIHAAASYKDPDDWNEDIITNCIGGATIARLSKEYNVKRLIYFQTSCAYGHEPMEQPITPKCPFIPDTSSYAITKATAEFFIKISGVEYISFRLANCYGPRTKTGPVPNFYKKLVAGEQCTVMNTRRDYIYIDDLCNVVLRAVYGEGTPGAYHISTGSDYAIEELYKTMADILNINKEPSRKEKGADDTYTLLISPEKTKKDFPGWSAETTLREGLEKTINYYKNNPPSDVYTHLRMTK
jgi:UDP-glucose 4-epimerase